MESYEWKQLFSNKHVKCRCANKLDSDCYAGTEIQQQIYKIYVNRRQGVLYIL